MGCRRGWGVVTITLLGDLKSNGDFLARIKLRGTSLVFLGTLNSVAGIFMFN
jgi:hypothetical protein